MCVCVCVLQDVKCMCVAGCEVCVLQAVRCVCVCVAGCEIVL